ncbi:hypothetical protein REPUB_Repub03eG0092900 [Reevesia pubescens]
MSPSSESSYCECGTNNVQSSSSGSSYCECGSNNVQAFFKKVVSESEVSLRNIYLTKNDVDTIIRPYVTPNQNRILNTAEGFVEVVVVDVKTGDRFKAKLKNGGYSYMITRITAMIKKMNIQAGDEIYFSWYDETVMKLIGAVQERAEMKITTAGEQRSKKMEQSENSEKYVD